MNSELNEYITKHKIEINDDIYIELSKMYRGYFFKIINNGFEYTADVVVAELLKINFEEYQKMLIEEYNGVMRGDTVWFNSIEDCAKACGWIRSLIILETINGNNFDNYILNSNIKWI